MFIVISIIYELLIRHDDVDWQRKHYACLTVILLLARVTAVVEAFFRSCRQLRCATAAVSLALCSVVVSIGLLNFIPASGLRNAVQARMIAVIGMAAFCLCHTLFLWSIRRSCGPHFLLMTALCSTIASVHLLSLHLPDDSIHEPAFAICATIFLVWAALLSPTGASAHRTRPSD